MRDLEAVVKIKSGERQAMILQDYQVLASVVSQALGGKPQGAETSSAPPPGTLVPKNMDEMRRAFTAVMGAR